MYKASLNGKDCIFFYDERISLENAPAGYPYMYHFRHDEDDWTKPISIEPFVFVNFFGTVFLKDPLEFGKEKYIDVKRFSFKSNLVTIKLRKSTMNKVMGL